MLLHNKKILVVIPYFVPAWSYGGPVKVAYDIAIGLKEKGYDVTVVTSDACTSTDRLAEKNEILEGIQIYRFRNISNRLAKFHNLYLPIGYITWLRNHISKYDLVHIHDIYNIFTYGAMYFAKKHYIPYILHPHGTLSETRIASRKSFLKKILLGLFAPYFANAKSIIALTEQEKIEINAISPDAHIDIVANGVEVDSIKKKFSLQELLNISSTTKVITYMGRIQYIKGLDFSLNALAKLQEKRNDRVFLILGPDEGEKAILERKAEALGIADKVIWYGLVSGEEKWNMLASSDLFLFLSRSEGLPMTILEALACGVPVVLSPECNVPEIEKSNAGYLVENDMPQKVAQKIDSILQNKEKYTTGAINLAKEKYSKTAMIDAISIIYQKKIESKNF